MIPHRANRSIPMGVLAVVAILFVGAAWAVPFPHAMPRAEATLRASALPILIVNATPWNGETIGSATPTIVVLYVDTNPNATVLGVDFHIDGMNLTSAGTFNQTAFGLPLALELRSGPHFATFAAFDSVGGSGSLSWMFTVDTIPPILLVTAPVYPAVPVATIPVEGTALLVNATLFAGAAPINVSATVLPSGQTTWTSPASNGSFVLWVSLTEGVNTIFVNATDRVGNFATVIKNILRDTTGPSLTILTPVFTPPVPVSPTSTVWVSGKTEPGAYVVVNGYSVAVSPLDGSWGVNLTLPDGLNLIKVVAADPVGNVNFAGVAILVDSDVPRLVLSSPTAAITNRSQVVVQGTVTDSTVVALYVNGAPVSWNASGGFRSILTFPDGANPIVVVAADAARRTAILQTSIAVDTTPPTVRVSTPPDGMETNQSTVLVRGTVDDASATILVNGQMIRPDASRGWQATVALVTGGNTVVVSAVDEVGNRATAVVLHVDYYSPFPALDNRTKENAQNLANLGAMVRLSLVGILLLALAVAFLLYTRTSKQIDETRRILIAHLQTRKPPPRK